MGSLFDTVPFMRPHRTSDPQAWYHGVLRQSKALVVIGSVWHNPGWHHVMFMKVHCWRRGVYSNIFFAYGTETVLSAPHMTWTNRSHHRWCKCLGTKMHLDLFAESVSNECNTAYASFNNSLGPSDAKFRWRSWSTLVQVMACCLTAPSHNLNQCWLIISNVLWHSSEDIIIRRFEDTNQ